MTKIITREVDSSAINFSEKTHPLLQRIYAARGVYDDADLDLGLQQLIPPQQLKGIDEAVEVIASALTAQQRILIIGDFDCDGATSSCLAVLALRAMGCQSVDYLVPNRFDFGYGLSPEIVDVAQQRSPDLLITVDNGISSIEGVAKAKSLGMKIVITDHHLAADELPEADAIVNPNQPGCDFSSKALAGVGVIFYVMLALRAYLRGQNWFTEQGITEPNMAEYLDIVALGTVADVVPLDRNNRILVHQGLQRMRAGYLRPGIKALLELGKKNLTNLAANDLGFAVGPRLNAAGRLDDISIGIQCLLSDSESEAMGLALVLDGFNRDRRLIEGQMRKEADAMMSHLDKKSDNLPWGLCLHHEDWHQGVIGILASRIKEYYHRPVIAFAKSDVEGELKGSARSIEGLHIRDALDVLAKRYPHLLKKFGGHAMAAGMTINTEHFDEFTDAFDSVVQDLMDESSLVQQILVDGEVAVSDLSLATAELLFNEGPWGQAFPEPIFYGQFVVVGCKILAEKYLKLVLQNGDNPQLFDAICFNVEDINSWSVDVGGSLIDCVYALSVNEFRGQRSLQLMIKSIVSTKMVNISP